MGAFVLFKKDLKLDKNKLISFFRKKNFLKEPYIKNFDNYILILFEKQLIDIKNFYEKDNSGVYSVGFFSYNGLSYSDSLKNLLNDLDENKFDKNKIIGNYFIIYKNKNNELYFLHDPLSYYSVFYNEEKTIISSSFLALLECSNKKYDLNYNSIYEILHTGALIGPDTIVDGIFRLENNLNSINNISRIITKPDIIIDFKLSKKELLKVHINYINDLFQILKNYEKEYGVNAGMTGGFDSRLLLSLIKHHFNNYSLYTHYRENEKDKDFSIAKYICQQLNINLTIIKENITQLNLEEILDNICYFVDGQIRAEIYWQDFFNSRDYKLKIFKNKLELNGIGGEQYRNVERMILPYWKFNNWLENEYLFKYSGNCFLNKSTKNEFVNYLKFKIETILNKKFSYFISHYDILRFINEVYNPANRVVRNSIDNQLVFAFSPFADPYLSIPAYNLAYSKGTGFSFQMELLKNLDPELAKFNSTYGFDFFHKEPFKNKLITIAHEILPFKTYNIIFRKFKNQNYSINLNKNIYIEFVNSLNLPIKIENIMKSKRLSPLVVELGFFINKYKNLLKNV